MENPTKNPSQQQPTLSNPEGSPIHPLIENSKEHGLHAAGKVKGKDTPKNETKIIQQKNTKQVEPNNLKAENPDTCPIDEKELPPFQAGKPTI